MFQGLQYAWIGLSIGIVLFVPGAAWLAWFRQPGKGFAAQLGTSTGVSLALTALVALASFVFHFRLYPWEVVIIYTGLAMTAGLGWLRSRKWRIIFRKSWFSWEFGLTMGIAALLVAWRLYQARDLALPAWVDSIHHALITRVIFEGGSLPGDLAPYLSVPFYYHYGFHALAAVFMAVSGLPVDQAVIILGQVINAGISLSVYRLSLSVWHDPKRGLAAALLVGFFSQMPAYYLTWGRYTLLAGLFILPLAMAEALDIVQEPEISRVYWVRHGLTMAVLTAGVLLSHYLAALLLAAFLILLGIALVWQDVLAGKFSLLRWAPLLGGTLSGLAASLPWLLRVFQYSGMALNIDVVLPKEIGGTGFTSSYASYLWYLAGPARNYWFLLIGGLGLLLGLIPPKSRLLAAWTGLVGLGCLPLGYKLSPFRQDHLIILVFFPAAIFAGHLIFRLGEWIKKFAMSLAATIARRKAALALADLIETSDVDLVADHATITPDAAAMDRPVRWVSRGVPVVVILGLCVWGAMDTLDILNSTTILADRADRQGLIWIQEHTPTDARFFINVTPWQGGIYRGVDGGWWILPLTGRWMLLPPVVYAWGDKSYFDQINTWAGSASTLKDCGTDFWKLVHDAHLTYVYLHQGSGSLQPEGLKACSGLTPVYQLGGVFIYTIQNGE